MRVRDHVALSSAVAALLYPRLRRSVLVPWAASIFIDIDHYLWFLARHRRLSPVAAVRFFNDANAPKHSATRPFHHPAVLLPLLLLTRRQRAAVLPLTGMAFHACLDTYHRLRTSDAHANALNRDHFTCQVCGTTGACVVAHVWRQPRLLPSYRLEHFVTLCVGCHDAAHAHRSGAVARLGCDWESYRDGVERRAQAKPATGTRMLIDAVSVSGPDHYRP
jgi:hypothetical protein